MSIFDDVKQSFKEGSSLTQLIYINIGVFLIVKILNLLAFLSGVYIISPVNWLAVPAYLPSLMYKPWTIISYMFLHEGFMHILFNMLILYWFGKIFLDYLNQKQLLSVYILGGIFGAFFFILFYNIFPAFNISKYAAVALGASASVMAVVVAISFYIPNNVMYLMFIGPVKMKYIAIGYIVLDVLSIAGTNSGGHIAHLGGALFGYLYISQLKQGRNITKGFDKFLDSIFSFFRFRRNPKMKVKYKRTNYDGAYTHYQDIEYNQQKKQDKERLNQILEKISKSGYDSLTKEEKEILFKASRNN